MDNAFPETRNVDGGRTNNVSATEFKPGLTKREYFAARALQGILATGRIDPSLIGEQLSQNVALSAIAYADALIEALGKAKP